jgi:hypothetical protein
MSGELLGLVLAAYLASAVLLVLSGLAGWVLDWLRVRRRSAQHRIGERDDRLRRLWRLPKED